MNSIDRMSQILQSFDGPATRQLIVAATKELKEKRFGSVGDVWTRTGKATAKTRSGKQAKPVREGRIGVVVVDLTDNRNLSEFTKNHVAGGEPMFSRLGSEMTKDTTIIVVSTMLGLLKVANRLRNWHHDYFTDVFLVRQPDGPEVSKSLAAGVAGRHEPGQLAPPSWDGSTDPVVYWTDLFSTASGRKVCIFGRKELDGWETIADDGGSRK